ncbi:MAG: hypothetical protein ACM34K_05745 [Bacillota bacterium]
MDPIKEAIKAMDPETKLKIVCSISHREPIDEENDFFELGMARMKGLVKKGGMELTPAGEEALYEIVKEDMKEWKSQQ